jgi:hypothetical protein
MIIKPISKTLWNIIKEGQEYKFYYDLRFSINCIDYVIGNKLYRVQQ